MGDVPKTFQNLIAERDATISRLTAARGDLFHELRSVRVELAKEQLTTELMARHNKKLREQIGSLMAEREKLEEQLDFAKRETEERRHAIAQKGDQHG